jgi:bacteriocin-like protein
MINSGCRKAFRVGYHFKKITMKKLSEEKLEKIEGGALPSIDDSCKIFGAVFALSNGAVPGSLDFQADAEIAYIACMLQYI